MAEGAGQCGVLILAAGAATRMGTPKQLLEIDGQPLVRRCAKSALASPARPVAVVLGANAAVIRPHLADLPVLIVENPDWPEGLGSSLRAGMRALAAAAPALDAVIVGLVDQPHFSAALIARLMAEQQRTAKPIVASRYGDHLGPPALFFRQHFAGLLAATGEAGARALLKAHAADVAAVDVAGAADLDTPEDYRRYIAPPAAFSGDAIRQP